MTNDLHDRLEYLVNYSSQLIFVSGDSIAQQQRTLETFVFQQHDDTEIAYISADSTMDVTDYRRQLCRQLLGQVVGSYIRPLNELLSALNNHEGPVLVAITQAEHIPDKLLQELWELVLQSRFAGNKQHLNVLLFAESGWAERAKKWLPAKNTDMPLLISSQSVQAAAPPQSDLDKLISERREAFHQHLLNRQQSLPSVRSLRSPWFITLVVLSFMGIFSSLVYWQYGDTLLSIFTPIEKGAVKTQPDAVQPGSALKAMIEASEHIQSTEPDKKEVSSVELVSDWQSNKNEEALEEHKPVNTLPGKGDASTTGSDIESLDTLSSSAASVKTSAVNTESKQVEDTITSARIEEKVTSISQPSMFINASDINPSARYIQLAGLSDFNLMKEFLSDNNLTEVTQSYRTYRYGGDWFVVISKQSYDSSSSANQAIAALPFYPSKGDAFVKTGEQIISEIGLSTETP